MRSPLCLLSRLVEAEEEEMVVMVVITVQNLMTRMAQRAKERPQLQRTIREKGRRKRKFRTSKTWRVHCADLSLTNARGRNLLRQRPIF
ncbi:hypothetical protein EMPG_13501 [Blastomyces silverae]|uniref:Uncharacterized protein n=1 Tax=Blastomyces silverae TaxID=2060906 RepID=A0A0H1BJC1_9EURO|nr:hypothetical protein EMPG_13501 [Blastomyces silverae]